jgi:hypothetical protein
MLGLALLALALGDGRSAEPTTQTVVYYNARMALREGNALEAVKLWLLRNAVESATGRVSAHDGDFGSVTWAALGELGLCQDGQPTDEAGAGLWPVALHNWAVANMRRPRSARATPFDAFQVGRQQRLVGIDDVLDADELGSVRLTRGPCYRLTKVLLDAGEPVTADLSDRSVTARVLRFLLRRALTTIASDRVHGRAAIEARLFDLELELTQLGFREAQADARTLAREGQALGLEKGALVAMRADAPAYSFGPASEAARVLRESVSWPAAEWMTLSPDRRLFLFHHARTFGGDAHQLDQVALGIVDQLVEERKGDEVEAWIGHRGGSVAMREAIWGGARGERLLSLDEQTGFRERSVVALHRGVQLLESGDLSGALRSFAFALDTAGASRESATVQALSLRWLSFVAAQFAIDDELLALLQALTPPREYATILEGMVWNAAFRADRASFDRAVRHQVGRGALALRIDLLRPLAHGDGARFVAQIGQELGTSPATTLRFLGQWVERLETEDADVRSAQVGTLRSIRRLALPLTLDEGNKGGPARQAQALVERCQSLLDGLDDIGDDARARARSQAPGADVFAGSVRLAPSDPLPWPFRAPTVLAPSVFLPLELRPEEWRAPSGELVFGWSIEG